MKYLKKYKLFEKQLKLFPNIKDYDDYKKTVDILVNKFKGDKVQPDTTKTVQEVINEYGDFNKLYKKNMEYDINVEEYQEVLSKYLADNLQIIPEMLLKESDFEKYSYFYEQLKEYKPDFDFKDIDPNENDFIQHVTDFIISLNFSDWEIIYYIDNEGLIDEDEIISYIENNYKDDINFEYYANAEYFDNLIYALENNEDNNYVKIYRMIDVPKDEKDLIEHLKNYSGTGEYWSYEFDGAIAHCGMGGQCQSVVLIANVSVGNVDWEQTFYKSVYALKEEREIEVQQNVTINLEGIVLNALESELYNIKRKEIDYIETVFKLDWSKKHELEHNLRNETNDKATIIFDEPIVVNT